MNNWQHRVRMTCIGVLILAVVLRLGSSAADLPPEDKEKAASFLFYLQTGRHLHLSPAPTQPTKDASTEAPAPEPEPPPVTEPQDPPLVFTQADADSLSVKFAGEYRPELGSLLQKPVAPDLSGTQPRVLILHTHATESYTQVPGWEYEDLGNYRTLDENHNMLRVGAFLAELLTEGGISVLHDKTLHDYPSYNGSYTRSLATIKTYLEAYPSIEMVIDVHRDAIETQEGQQLTTAFSLNGESSARIMLVMGTDEGGLSHPNWEDNLSWALKLQAGMERLYPGLPRTLSLRKERFNQHMTPCSLLVEVGTAGDTLEQALKAAECFGQTLIKVAKSFE